MVEPNISDDQKNANEIGTRSTEAEEPSSKPPLTSDHDGQSTGNQIIDGPHHSSPTPDSGDPQGEDESKSQVDLQPATTRNGFDQEISAATLDGDSEAVHHRKIIVMQSL